MGYYNAPKDPEALPSGQPRAYGPPPPLAPPSKAPRGPLSRLAVAGLICAFLCTPIGLLISIIALLRIQKSEGRLGGFTHALAGALISAGLLVVALPVGGMVAAIVIPMTMMRRQEADQAKTRATLVRLSEAQAGFRQRGDIDQDQDDAGEFAFLSELAGLSPLRGGTTLKSSINLPGAELLPGGVVRIEGLYLISYLPGPDGTGLVDGPTLASDPQAADGQEGHFIIYAWRRGSGRRARVFVLREDGNIFTTWRRGANGPNAVPTWDFALTDTNGDGQVTFGPDGVDQGWWNLE